MVKDGIYFYKEFGVEEVIDLKTVQCCWQSEVQRWVGYHWLEG